MNYLAHAYLSFNLPDILLGNMISDYVKGKLQYTYPLPVQQGIRLHRDIDTFTDQHEATRDLKSIFRPHYRLYSGAFTDVVYDHFLANDKSIFPSEKELRHFTSWCYRELKDRQVLFPDPFSKMFPYMQEQDWLYHYRYPEGIHKSFYGLKRRAAHIAEAETAFALFMEHYETMRACYAAFFPELKSFAAYRLEALLNA